MGFIMRVLIAEADCEVINDITIALNVFLPDCELIITNTGKDCLDKIKVDALGLVILGLDLPDMSGLDVLNKIRGSSDAAIIALSPKNDKSSMVKALNSGADQCIAKPFKQLEFIARVKVILRRGPKESVVPNTKERRA